MKRILLTSILCASTIFAASDPSKTYAYEVTPFASGILTDSKVSLKDDNYSNIGISLAKNISGLFINQVELAYMRSSHVDYNDNLGTTNVNRMFLNAIKQFQLTDKLAAYGLAGVGYQNVSQELNEHQDSAIVNYGVGLKYDIPYYGIALKGDVRHLIAIEENQNDVMYTLGLGMPLGKVYKNDINQNKKTTVTETAPVPYEKPKVAQVVEKINNDNDNDGVINKLDKCPNSSPGTKVNKDGCAQTIDLKINFDTNLTNIKPIYENELQEFANILKKDESLTALIEAHTDSEGSDADNQTLSNGRADSVVNYLKNHGVDSSKLEAIGYGETQPVADNETEEGKAKNRRVTAFINQ